MLCFFFNVFVHAFFVYTTKRKTWFFFVLHLLMAGNLFYIYVFLLCNYSLLEFHLFKLCFTCWDLNEISLTNLVFSPI